MKKLLSLILALAMVFTLCSCGTAKTVYYDEYGEALEIELPYDDESSDEYGTYKTHYEALEDGTGWVMTASADFGDTVYTTTQYHGADGKITRTVSDDTTGILEVVYTYNDDGTYSEHSTYSSPDWSYACDTVYDAENRTVSGIDYDEDGSIYSERHYEYSEDGAYTVHTDYTGSEWVYSYDEEYSSDGLILFRTEYDKNGELEYTAQYTYSGDVLKTVEFVYYADGLMTGRSTEEYKEDGMSYTSTYEGPYGVYVSEIIYNSETGEYEYNEISSTDYDEPNPDFYIEPFKPLEQEGTFVYDDDGTLRYKEEYVAAGEGYSRVETCYTDGEEFRVLTDTFDANYDIISSTVETAFGFVSEEIYTYHEDGSQTQAKKIYVKSGSTGSDKITVCDWAGDDAYEYEYDLNNGEGTVIIKDICMNSTDTYTFGAGGVLTARVSEDWWGTYEYSYENGCEISTYYDEESGYTNIDAYSMETGREVYSVYYNDEYRDEYYHDAESGLVTQHVCYINGEKDSEEFYAYEYDENGNIAKIVTTDEKGSVICSEEYIYDENGNNIEYVEYDGEGNIQYRSVHLYDENGNIIESVDYDGEGNILYRNVNIYDENGNNIESVDYDGDGNIQYRYVYLYDEDGWSTGYTLYDGEGNVTDEQSW